MKALSLWQPWASLWVSGRKIHETRHWPLTVPQGGFWLAVHAAKKPPSDIDPELASICRDQFGPIWTAQLPYGAIIGRVHVTRCRRTEDVLYGVGASDHFPDSDDYCCGNFGPGRFAFETDDRRARINPLPYRGLQGLFSIPDLPALGERAA